MKDAIKFAFGVVGAWVLIYLSVTAYGLAAAYLPIPRSWWGAFSWLVIYGTEVISFVPFALVGALATFKLFKTKRVLQSFACFFIALLISFSSLAFETTEMLGAALRLSLEFILIFVVGVPFLVFLLQRR